MYHLLRTIYHLVYSTHYFPFTTYYQCTYDLLSPFNSVGGDIVTRPFVGGWVRSCFRGFVPLYLVDTIGTTVFAQSLSNFTCKLWMMRGGTLLILDHGSKVKVNFGTLCIRPCDTIQTTIFAQSLSNFTCKLWMMRGGTLLILGHGVKG